jgi:hypothetical protein
MTAQIGDRFEYNGRRYAYVMKSDNIGFHPREYGITPSFACTACWAGYWCEYSIKEEGLFLKNLFVNSMDDNYPDIEGVSVSCGERENLVMGHHVYRNVNKHMKYTGKLLLGNDFISEYYVHMGYQGYWAYGELVLFAFVDGVLVEMKDVSKLAAMKRKQINEQNESFFERLRKKECIGFTPDEYKYFCKNGEQEFFKEISGESAKRSSDDDIPLE